MIKSLIYNLPAAGEDGQAAFQALKSILACPQTSAEGNALCLSSAPDLSPSTIFRLDGQGGAPQILLQDEESGSSLPQGLFLSGGTGTEQMISLPEAARQLAGNVTAIDHTGIVAPGGMRTAPSDWTKAVNMLASKTAFYDYPASPEYNSETSRWLFVIPAAENEQTDGPRTLRLRQPKFELVWDRDAANMTVLQIDMETKLSRDTIAAAFPESYEFPGLGRFFRSVDIISPWPGISCIRLDLRYGGDGALNEWNSAKWLIDSGTRVHENEAPAMLPGHR